MIKQHIQFIFRIFKRNKSSYSFNTLGLTLGFFAAISALYLATSQIGYNTCFKDSNKIVRVINYDEEEDYNSAKNAYNLGPTISTTYPEITEFCRIAEQNAKIELPGKKTFKERLHFVDSSIVKMFNLTFIYGDSQTAFQNPNSLVLTAEYAKKLFGNENPIGNEVNISWYDYNSNVFIVTGIIKEPEGKSTIDFGLLTNVSIFNKWSLKQYRKKYGPDGNVDGWIDMEYETYIKLINDHSANDVFNKINKNGVKDYPGYFELSYLFQPIKDIFFSTMNVQDDPSPHGNFIYVVILSLVGFVILFLSCFNYIILSTSQAILRSKEFGIRKVVGANSKWIFSQTTIEYLFFTLIAVFVSIILVKLLYPIMNNWFGRQAEFSLFSYPIFIPGLVMIILITVFLSTIYLNVFISRSNPVNAIAGTKGKSKSRVSLQHLLIGLQLIVFCIIFTSLLSMNKQIRYLNNYNVGFDMNNLVVLSNPVMEDGGSKKYNLFKSKILTYPQINSITSISFSSLPVDELESMKINYNDEENKSIYCDNMDVQYDFIKTFGIKLKNGRDLTQDNFPSPRDDYYGYSYYCLLSQSAVKALNISDPVGKIIMCYGEDSAEIVGVIDDFYVTSFYKQPKPIVLCLGIDSDYYDSYFISLANNANKEDAIQSIKKVWNEVFPDTNFTYSFYKDDYEHLYKKTHSAIKMVVVFSLFALILSVISLYGMSKHISNLRLKEMTVRRVIGATVKETFIAMTKSFLILTLICNIISIPVSVIIYNHWQKQFAFHTSFSYMNVVYTFLASSLIVLTAVSAIILKTANKPINEVLNEN